jgi:Protein of unknown function (DUF3800)
MLVFINESGDPGFKLGSGSTRYFVVTLVIFEDNDEANNADQRIDLLKHELGFPPHFEFHFTNLKSSYRQQFLNAVVNYGFFYFAIVVNKEKLTGPGFQFKESFYKYTCSLVFENAKPHLANATVVIDGSGSREFRRQLENYLRRRVNDPRSGRRFIGKIKIQTSRSNNLLQLADMICGAVARSYSSRTDAQLYRSIVAPREIYVQFWPK